MSDLKLESIFMVDPVDNARITDSLKNENIIEIWKRYINNMENVALLMVLPINLVKHAPDIPHISAVLFLNSAWADRRSERFVSSRMEADAKPEPNPAAPR